MSGPEKCVNTQCVDYGHIHWGMCSVRIEEDHRLNRVFWPGFHDTYMNYIKKHVPLGASIELKEPVTCVLCGVPVLLPISHKNWHKKHGDV